jgi:uncharacterized protein (TIRG00374 family)
MDEQVTRIERADGADARRVAARAVVTLALLAFVLWRLDLRALAGAVSGLAWPWVLATFAVIYAAIGVSTWKWGAILARRGLPAGFPALLRLYMIGQFFNNVLPTTIGGDVVRSWEHAKASGSVPGSAGSVVSERLIAGVAQGAASLVALAFVSASPVIVRFAVGFLALDAAFIALFAVPKVAEGIVRPVLGRRFAGTADVVTQTVAEVGETLRDPWLVVRVGLLSLVFQICVAGVNYCIFRAMGVPVTLGQCVVFTPMIFTVTPLPISIAGFGVREASYVFFFGQAGVSASAAVAASFLFFGTVAVASLPGAPVWALARRGATP